MEGRRVDHPRSPSRTTAPRTGLLSGLVGLCVADADESRQALAMKWPVVSPVSSNSSSSLWPFDHVNVIAAVKVSTPAVRPSKVVNSTLASDQNSVPVNIFVSAPVSVRVSVSAPETPALKLTRQSPSCRALTVRQTESVQHQDHSKTVSKCFSTLTPIR